MAAKVAAKFAPARAESMLGRRFIYTTSSLTKASSLKHPLVGDDTVMVANDRRSLSVEFSVISFVEVVSHEKVKAIAFKLRQLGNHCPVTSGENDIHSAVSVQVASDMANHGLVLRRPLLTISLDELFGVEEGLIHEVIRAGDRGAANDLDGVTQSRVVNVGRVSIMGPKNPYPDKVRTVKVGCAL